MAKGDGVWGLVRDWGLAFAITGFVLLVWRLLAPAPVAAGIAPALELPTLTGERYVLAEQEAPVYVVNFWATWCAPCVAEIPMLNQFALANPDVVVLGVSIDELSPRVLSGHVERLGIRYPVLHDERSRAAGAWGVSSYPTTFVVDAHHHVRSVHTGQIDRTKLDAMVHEALTH